MKPEKKIKIADQNVSLKTALETVRNYADRFPRTLEIFDGLGEQGYVDEHPNEITLADIGRLVVINARLKANDVPALLDGKVNEALNAVPRDANLADCIPGSDLWDAASTSYSQVKGSSIGPAKRSKLLHAKRPGLFFINDTVTRSAYKASAKRIAAQADFKTEGFWQAAREDIQQVEFTELMSEVAQMRAEHVAGRPTLASLTAVRILDIVCWSLNAG